MDIVALITELFKSVGASVEHLQTTGKYHYGRLTGDGLKSGPTWIKADELVCNITATLGPFPATGNAASIAISLLKLNFKHPFGRVSAVDLPQSGGIFVVCETMFFIRQLDEGLTKELRERLHNLSILVSAAKAILDEAGS